MFPFAILADSLTMLQVLILEGISYIMYLDHRPFGYRLVVLIPCESRASVISRMSSAHLLAEVERLVLLWTLPVSLLSTAMKFRPCCPLWVVTVARMSSFVMSSQRGPYVLTTSWWLRGINSGCKKRLTNCDLRATMVNCIAFRVVPDATTLLYHFPFPLSSARGFGCCCCSCPVAGNCPY